MYSIEGEQLIVKGLQVPGTHVSSKVEFSERLVPAPEPQEAYFLGRQGTHVSPNE
jgi:hypothetical protein